METFFNISEIQSLHPAVKRFNSQEVVKRNFIIEFFLRLFRCLPDTQETRDLKTRLTTLKTRFNENETEIRKMQRQFPGLQRSQHSHYQERFKTITAEWAAQTAEMAKIMNSKGDFVRFREFKHFSQQFLKLDSLIHNLYLDVDPQGIKTAQIEKDLKKLSGENRFCSLRLMRNANTTEKAISQHLAQISQVYHRIPENSSYKDDTKTKLLQLATKAVRMGLHNLKNQCPTPLRKEILNCLKEIPSHKKKKENDGHNGQLTPILERLDKTIGTIQGKDPTSLGIKAKLVELTLRLAVLTDKNTLTCNQKINETKNSLSILIHANTPDHLYDTILKQFSQLIAKDIYIDMYTNQITALSADSEKYKMGKAEFATELQKISQEMHRNLLPIDTSTVLKISELENIPFSAEGKAHTLRIQLANFRGVNTLVIANDQNNQIKVPHAYNLDIPRTLSTRIELNGKCILDINSDQTTASAVVYQQLESASSPALAKNLCHILNQCVEGDLSDALFTLYPPGVTQSVQYDVPKWRVDITEDDVWIRNVFRGYFRIESDGQKSSAQNQDEPIDRAYIAAQQTIHIPRKELESVIPGETPLDQKVMIPNATVQYHFSRPSRDQNEVIKELKGFPSPF